MIEDVNGCIDYAENGRGETLLFVPGSCSTGAAWRSVIAALDGGFRCVTTSLLGYGRTAERRTANDGSIVHEAEVIEIVARETGGPVHLVGHSFGGLVSLAVALRKRVALKSLVIVEAPAAELLRQCNEDGHYRAFKEMTETYFAAFEAGHPEAIATMIDFYGGQGTYASWPPRVRAYAVETTAVNILDWASGYGFAPPLASLAAIAIPTLVMWGGASHPAVQRANALLSQLVVGATSAAIEGAAHFMISSHATEVAHRIANHVRRAEARGSFVPLGQTNVRPVASVGLRGAAAGHRRTLNQSSATSGSSRQGAGTPLAGMVCLE
ncbi:MAG: alpha/beta fold hydrolase [Acidobacteriota bacterium]